MFHFEVLLEILKTASENQHKHFQSDLKVVVLGRKNKNPTYDESAFKEVFLVYENGKFHQLLYKEND